MGFGAASIDTYHKQSLITHKISILLICSLNYGQWEIIKKGGEKQGKNEEGHELYISVVVSGIFTLFYFYVLVNRKLYCIKPVDVITN